MRHIYDKSFLESIAYGENFANDYFHFTLFLRCCACSAAAAAAGVSRVCCCSLLCGGVGSSRYVPKL